MIRRASRLSFLFVISSLFLTSFFNNCSPSALKTSASNLSLPDDNILGCGDHCNDGSTPPVSLKDIPSSEAIDTRQHLESYMSLLDLSKADLTTNANDLNRVVAEKTKRSGLLPAESNAKLVSSIVMISQSSLAGELCRIYVEKKMTTADYFKGINLTDLLEKTTVDQWTNAWKKMSIDFYGRDPYSEEISAISDLISTNIEDSKTSLIKSDKIGTLNAEVANLGLALCTVTLTSPEASGL